MPLFKRSDGTLLKNLPGFRRLNPYLMTSRTEATIFIPFHADVTDTIKYVEDLSERLGKKISIFSVLLTAIIRTFATRPQLNRFCEGTKLYQRNEIIFSFVVKKQYKDQAKESNVKLAFSPYETIFTVIDKLDEEINKARTEEYHGDKDVNFFGKMPGFVLRIATNAFRFLNKHNLAPASMIKTDPLFCSAFITNMGSVGMKLGPHHHLFMWGNASLFLGISAHTKRPVVDDKGEIVARDILDLIVTWDDRIADGFYGQRSAEVMINYIENPKQLEEEPIFSDEIIEELKLKDYPLGKK